MVDNDSKTIADDVFEMLNNINSNVNKLVDLNGNPYPHFGAE